MLQWNIEDITCPPVDMNFVFECSTRYRVELEKIKFISAIRRACNIGQYSVINTSEKSAIYDVTITKVITSRVKIYMLFSRVTIWSFYAKAHLVFHWGLYNKNILVPPNLRVYSNWWQRLPVYGLLAINTEKCWILSLCYCLSWNSGCSYKNVDFRLELKLS